MTTLVTGANGFSGSHVVRALLRRGHAVRGLVRPTSDLRRLNGLDFPLVKGDITDRHVLGQACEGVETVIHTAAYVELGIVDAAEMDRVNVEGTRAILDAAVAAGVSRFVHCSTIGVLGDTSGEIVDETFRRVQRGYSSAYDRTKHQAQELVDAYGERGLGVVSVLPSGILGPSDPHFGPVVRRFLSGRLKLWAGGARVTGIVHVEDVAGALVLAAEMGAPGERYIASSGEMTTREMFALLGATAGIPPPKEMPEALVRAIGFCLTPIGKVFSWNPPLSRERVHYLYDRCVRVDATKARRDLRWTPLAPEETVRSLIPTTTAT